MSNDYQAKQGFKTFIITLSLSLVIFGAFYYLITDSHTKADIEEETFLENPENQVSELPQTQGSVFRDIAQKEIEVPSRAILAGADELGDETTESTVPDTGSSGMTMAFIISLAVISLGIYRILSGPRKLALSTFERKTTKNL